MQERFNISRHVIAAIAFLALFIFSSRPVQAQEFATKAWSVRKDFLLGDKVNVKLEVRYPESYTLKSTPDFKEHLGLEKIDSTRSHTHQEGNTMVLEVDHFVSAYDSGAFYFPARTYEAVPKAGGAGRTLITDSVRLHFNRLEVDTTQDIKPIKAPIQVPRSFSEYLPWLLGGLAVIILAFILFFIWKRRRRHLYEVKTILTAEEAYEMLAALEEEKLYEKGKVKQHYTRASVIMRRYLGGAAGLQYLGLTTKEWVHAAAPLMTAEENARLMELLEKADLVKFARYIPEDIESAGLTARVRELVKAVERHKMAADQQQGRRP